MPIMNIAKEHGFAQVRRYILYQAAKVEFNQVLAISNYFHLYTEASNEQRSYCRL
jgi:hypothetical protein